MTGRLIEVKRPEYFYEIRELFKRIPERTAVTDELGNVLSYGDLDNLSARTCSYLKAAGITKGDFVMIHLKRSAMIPAAMMGAIRAGAAFTVLEEGEPEERVKYIYEDCGCRLKITEETWAEILKTEPDDDWTDADDHDILTAAYTSGTTGSPKGVVLERGILDLNALSSDVVAETGAFCRGDAVAVNYPLNFIVFTICFGFFYMGGTLHILSYQTAKDPKRYIQYLNEKRPQIAFLIPSLYKILADKLPESVRSVFLGGERAGDVPEQDGRYVVNIYSATEIGFVCAYSVSYGGTEALSLKKLLGRDGIYLADENGRPVSEGVQGEISVKVPYARGYIGLEDETEKHFRGGYFRTGDMGISGENGSIICCGRMDAMIKIGGKRVEPEEVSAAFQKVTGIGAACAKGFTNGKRDYLCLFYQNKEPVHEENVLAEMAKILPEYMLPSYFICMESLPRVSNGKIDHASLHSPDIRSARAVYLPPSGEVEENLCHAFSTVFEIERIGVREDFLSLGGDSLSAVELLLAADQEYLTVYDLYEGNSIKELAVLIAHRKEMPQTKSVSLENRTLALTAAQEYYLKWQLKMPDSTIYNLPAVIRFKKPQFEAAELARAVSETIAAHPALLTQILYENGRYVQRIEPSYICHPVPEKITEEELKEQIKRFVKPFEVIGNPLYRVEVFETEEAAYLFFDVSHTVFDGESFELLLEELLDDYDTDANKRTDRYLEYIASCEEAADNDKYRSSVQYFEGRYRPKECSVFPDKDWDGGAKTAGTLVLPMEYLIDGIESFKKREKVTSNSIYVMSSLFAMAAYNGCSRVYLCWLYSCRAEKRYMNSIGLFNHELPVQLELSMDMSLSQMLHSVNEQIREDIARSECDWGYMEPTENMSFVYQKDIFSNAAYKAENIDILELSDVQNTVDNDFTVEVIDDSDGLVLYICYDSSEYSGESVRRFAEIYLGFLEYIVSVEDWETKTVKDALEELKKREILLDSYCLA